MIFAPLRVWAPAIVIFVIGLVIPFLVEGGFQLRLAMLIWIYSIFGIGFNLLFGLAGQLSLGQQAFFAIGAYAFALTQARLDLSLPLAVMTSLIVCVVVSLAMAVPLLRLRTHYLAMATLMFAMIVHDVALRWTDVTGGVSGLRVPLPMIFGVRLERISIYYIVFAIAVVAFLTQAFIKATHLGRALEAVKKDETAALSLGVDVVRYKVSVFVLAAMLAAMAGISYALISRGVDPSYSDISVAVNLLTLSVIGGLGTNIGPILGAAIIILAPQLLVGLQEYQTLIYGVGLLVCMIFAPRGLGGIIESIARKSTRKNAVTSGEAL